MLKICEDHDRWCDCFIQLNEVKVFMFSLTGAVEAHLSGGCEINTGMSWPTESLADFPGVTPCYFWV